jgi:hypothetical protein
VVKAGRCGPGGGDGWANAAVPGHGCDGNDGGGYQGGGGLVPGVALKAEEEQDSETERVEERGDDGDSGGGARWRQ